MPCFGLASASVVSVSSSISNGNLFRRRIELVHDMNGIPLSEPCCAGSCIAFSWRSKYRWTAKWMAQTRAARWDCAALSRKLGISSLLSEFGLFCLVPQVWWFREIGETQWKGSARDQIRPASTSYWRSNSKWDVNTDEQRWYYEAGLGQSWYPKTALRGASICCQPTLPWIE